MFCKECSKKLKLVKRLVRESNDEIVTYTEQWWKCPGCKRVYYAELSEYVSNGSYEYAFYAADPELWKDDVKIVKKCPSPENPKCKCKAHNISFFQHYSKRLEYGHYK